MSYYAHTSVKLDLLKEWTRNLDVEEVIRKSGLGLYGKYSDEKICRELLDGFRSNVENLNEGDDWRETTLVLNKALMPAIFKVADNAIKVANFYEILVEASDVATKKKLIKGYDSLDVGYLHIKNGEQFIATIGEKSDLMWAVLFELFIKEDVFSINHTLPQHESIMALQLYDVWEKTDEGIRRIVDEIIFKCSTELDMHFKVVHLDKKITKEGVSGYYELHTKIGEYEHIPMMYFNSALAIEDVRIKYLSFYQVAEYYYNRAQNHNLVDTIIAGNYIDATNINHKSLKKALIDYVASTTERESLKLVLKKAINITDLQRWVQSSADYENRYCHSCNAKMDLDFSKPEDKILGRLMERIYSYRCSIAHAKGDIDEYVALPEASNAEISNELPLIRYVAERVIKSCARW